MCQKQEIPHFQAKGNKRLDFDDVCCCILRKSLKLSQNSCNLSKFKQYPFFGNQVIYFELNEQSQSGMIELKFKVTRLHQKGDQFWC